MLRSTDVIHSFWVPLLAGKTDMIPGRENVAWLRADTAGIYRGQCVEYCGLQHAHMAFQLVAVPAEEFDAWRAQWPEAAEAPEGPEAATDRAGAGPGEDGFARAKTPVASPVTNGAATR